MTTAAAGALACAGVMAAGPASAADMLSVGVGGYMQQWFGYANRDDAGAEGGWDTQSDSEVHFKGSLESDMGLKYTIHVELEGNQNGDKAAEIDESFARVSGEFGQIEFGARDHAMVRMHSGISDVGVGITSGDTQKWIPGAYLETAGHAGTAGGGDSVKLNYISPRISGLQIGVSYAPDSTNESGVTSAPKGNDDASWGAAVNFSQEVGDMAVTFSLGHRSRSQTGEQMVDASGRNHLCGLTTKNVDGGSAKYSALANTACDRKALDSGGHEKGTTIVGATDVDAAGQNELHFIPATTKSKLADDATYTNAGVGVSFGAFKFNVAYATSDGGAYKVQKTPIMYAVGSNTATDAGDVATTAAALKSALADVGRKAYKKGTADLAAGALFVSGAEFNWADKKMDDPRCPATGDGACNDAMANNLVAEHTEAVVSDTSKDFDVWGVSVTYTDGPMSISLGHMTHETDAGTERNATMLSGSYTLAPGVAWKTSIFQVEDNTGTDDATTMADDETDAEGTAFVTGITLSF